MADITMCAQELCPNAGHCYRRTAEPSQWQSISLFKYKIGLNGVECDHYWPLHTTTTATSTTAKVKT